MGLNRSKKGGRRYNSTQRLGALCAELEPTRNPWYVDQPRGRTPSTGWWWIPPNTVHEVFLGHNHIVAEMQLRTLLDAQDKPEKPLAAVAVA